MFSLYQIKIAAFSTAALFLMALSIYNFATPSFPPLFYLKRVEEKIIFNLQMSASAKVDYNLYLLDRRLSEMKDMVKNEHFSCVLGCSLRYSGILANTTDLIISGDLRNKKEKGLQKFQNNKRQLEDLVNNYPKDKNPEWKYIQDNINYTDIYSKKLMEFN